MKCIQFEIDQFFVLFVQFCIIFDNFVLYFTKVFFGEVKYGLPCSVKYIFSHKGLRRVSDGGGCNRDGNFLSGSIPYFSVGRHNKEYNFVGLVDCYVIDRRTEYQ